MSDLMSEFQFPLKRSEVSYSSGGEQATAGFIQLTAPTSRHSKECAFLKQAFFRAIPKDQDADPDAVFEKPSGDEVMTILAMSNDVDLGGVLEVAAKLFTQPGVALIDGEAKLTKHILDQFHQDDFESMVGEYLVNFTLASSLERMSEK